MPSKESPLHVSHPLRANPRSLLALAGSKKTTNSNSLKHFLGLAPNQKINDKGFTITNSQKRRRQSQRQSVEPPSPAQHDDINFTRYFKKTQDFLFSKHNKEMFEKKLFFLAK